MNTCKEKSLEKANNPRTLILKTGNLKIFIIFGPPNDRSGASLTLSSALGTLFLLLGCLTQSWYEGLCLALLYLCYAMCGGDSWEAYSFVKGDGAPLDLRERWSWEGRTMRSGGRKNFGQEVLKKNKFLSREIYTHREFSSLQKK